MPLALPLSSPTTSSPRPTPRSRLAWSYGGLIALAGLCLFATQTSTPNAIARIDVAEYCPTTVQSIDHVPTVLLVGSQLEEPKRNRTFHLVTDSFLPYKWPQSRKLDLSAVELAIKFPQSLEIDGAKLCSLHEVPSSAVVTTGFDQSSILYGMSTNVNRALIAMPLWAHWLGRSHLLVLTPPLSPSEELLAERVKGEADRLSLSVRVQPFVADRFETRYLALAKEMLAAALLKEKAGAAHIKWFIVADDDSFWPDPESLHSLLRNYDSDKLVMIGALSESYDQVATFGRIAFGGAGIYISRPLLERMNGPGTWDKCLQDFGGQPGGDAMMSLCAASAVESVTTIEETIQSLNSLLTIDDTLHQLDVQGDGTGFFESGFLLTSIHHFLSWFRIFPSWHISGNGDLRRGVLLIGEVSKLIGGSNFGRRYVFDEGKTVVSLGYSVVSYPLVPISRSDLGKTEHTWDNLRSHHPLRNRLRENVDKVTYYVTDVIPLAPGVVQLIHTNRNGGRMDVIFDARGSEETFRPGQWSQFSFSTKFLRMLR